MLEKLSAEIAEIERHLAELKKQIQSLAESRDFWEKQAQMQNSERALAVQRSAELEEALGEAIGQLVKAGILQSADRETSVTDTSTDEDTISDGFGNYWSIVCPECEGRTMEIVRPGKVQCSECG